MTDTDLLDLARTAALAGGQAILPFVDRPRRSEAKADGSPVTPADMAAHHAILEALAPSVLPVLSEESSAADLAEVLHPACGAPRWTRFWCVDPLDGTREFVAGQDEFAVNVALVEGGFPVLGVVHVPVSGVTYSGSAAGAWKETPGEARRPIAVREPAPGRLVVATSRRHTGPVVEALLEAIRAVGIRTETRAVGSALKPCLVAEGAADLYPRPGPTNAWDTAAPQAVLEAAGGFLGDWDGRRLGVDPARPLNPPVVAWGSAAVAEAWPRWSGR